MKKDGWTNVLVGLGKKKDKQKKTEFGSVPIIESSVLEQLYIGDGISAKIVDVVADDMTREWINLVPSDSEEESQVKAKNTIKEVFDSCGVETSFNEALKWARLYGGSLLVLQAPDGQGNDKPLVPEKIRELKLKVIAKNDILFSSCGVVSDPESPQYGEIETWAVYVQQANGVKNLVTYHASRVIPFFGKRVSGMDGLPLVDRYFGLSELQVCYSAIRDFGGVGSGIVNMLYETAVGKYKIAGLAGLIASQQEDKVQKRLELIDMMKSVLNAVVLDTADDYVRDQLSFSGVGDMVNFTMLSLSAVADIPVTRLFGRSPAGLNSTGESDLNNYYDKIRAKQRVELKPKVYRLIEIVSAWQKVEPVEVVFNSLFQLTDKEKAEITKIEQERETSKANMYKTYCDMGVLDSDDVYSLEWEKTIEVVDAD